MKRSLEERLNNPWILSGRALESFVVRIADVCFSPSLPFASVVTYSSLAKLSNNSGIDICSHFADVVQSNVMR